MKQVRANKSTGIRILYLISLTIIIRFIHVKTDEITAVQPGISILAKYLKQETYFARGIRKCVQSFG
jgi:hypothetical protein